MILCLDTISAGGVAVVVQEQVFWRALPDRHVSDALMMTVDALIREAGGAVRELEGIMVIKGPGSFTGLRVALSVANAFAYSLRISLVGLRTDEWWLARTKESEALFVQSMNAAEVYAAYEKEGKRVSAIVALEHLSVWTSCRKWVGVLNQEHRQKLSPDFKEITPLHSPAEAWKHLATQVDFKNASPLPLEPFYGKPAHITVSKNSVAMKPKALFPDEFSTPPAP